MAALGSLRERKKEQTRIDLLNAAVDLFNERGYEGTTVDDIVERANYSRTTFFRYFGSKEDVVFGDVPDRIARVHEALPAAGADDPLRVVRDTLRDELARYSSPDSGVDARMVALWFSEPELERRYIELLSSAEKVFADFLRVSRPSDDPELEAQVIATALIGVVTATMRLRLSDPSAAQRALDRGFDLLDRGLSGGP